MGPSKKYPSNPWLPLNICHFFTFKKQNDHPTPSTSLPQHVREEVSACKLMENV